MDLKNICFSMNNCYTVIVMQWGSGTRKKMLSRYDIVAARLVEIPSRTILVPVLLF